MPEPFRSRHPTGHNISDFRGTRRSHLDISWSRISDQAVPDLRLSPESSLRRSCERERYQDLSIDRAGSPNEPEKHLQSVTLGTDARNSKYAPFKIAIGKKRLDFSFEIRRFRDTRNLESSERLTFDPRANSSTYLGETLVNVSWELLFERVAPRNLLCYAFRRVDFTPWRTGSRSRKTWRATSLSLYESFNKPLLGATSRIIYFIANALANNRYPLLVCRVDREHQTFVVLNLLQWSKNDRYGDRRACSQRFWYRI